MTPQPTSSTSAGVCTPEAIGESLAAFRSTGPLVQCLTNIVVAQWTANVLLAAGAAPAMVDNPYEAAEFARIPVPGAVLINLGTPQDHTVAAMRDAVAAATQAQRPWVLDPVAAGGLAWRTGLALELLELRPAVVRGNASEIAALAGGAGGRGVDATDDAAQVLEVARELATRFETTIAVSGPVDHITDGERVLRLGNGHPWMTRVTGVGCALGALVAGFCAVTEDRLLAAAAATTLLTVAAEDAAGVSAGPGSFAVALLDTLSAVQPAQLSQRVAVS